MNGIQFNSIVLLKTIVSPEVIILRIAPSGFELKPFIPGQYTLLGLPETAPRIPQSDKESKPPAPEKWIRRPYSVASSSVASEYLEFYIALVRSGALSPRLFHLEIGDRLYCSCEFRGIFTLKEVPKEQNIVLIATGTGLSPYMSMIRTQVSYGFKNRIAVIHGARHSWDLGYSSELFTLQKSNPQFTYLPVVSMPSEEPVPWKGYAGFIHELWKKNILEKHWGFRPSNENTHVFLCGNPLMIKGIYPLLTKQGFKEHSPKEPGQIHVEKFFGLR